MNKRVQHQYKQLKSTRLKTKIDFEYVKFVAEKR